MGIVELLNHVGIDCDHVMVDGRRIEKMANVVNDDGVVVPLVGDNILYVPEEGKIWAAVCTGIVQDTMVMLTAFPPGENPRGIARAISYDDNVGQDTWHWKAEV